MTQPLFPSTIGTQSCFSYFLTVKAVVRKFGKSDGQTSLDKAVLAQRGGGGGFQLDALGRVLVEAGLWAVCRCGEVCMQFCG